MPPHVVPSEEISHRYDFSLLAVARGYKDAVEVGTDQGVFAKDFLTRWTGNWLILVDPYEPYAELPYDRTGDLIVAAQALAPFHGRFRFVRHRSPAAIPFILTFCSPSFVYVDGSHEEADVAADLAAWWAVLPEHGMLAGHDYDALHPGVVAAVDRFARDRDVVVRTTHEEVAPKSWYVYRKEPARLFQRLYRAGETANARVPQGA